MTGLRMQFYIEVKEIYTVEWILRLEVQSLNTVLEIKQKIHKEKGIPIEQQYLLQVEGFYTNKYLKDECTMSDYDIDDGDTLLLHIKREISGDPITILVPDYKGERFNKLKISIGTLNTIQDLRVRIFLTDGFYPAENLQLIYGHRYLNNLDRTLENIGICHNSCIYIFMRQRGGGSYWGCISSCSECQHPPDRVMMSCKVVNEIGNSAKLYPSKDDWAVLCDIYNISRNIRELIKANSESAAVRFVDVMHRLLHADPTRSCRDIKTKLKLQCPDLAKVIKLKNS